MFLADLYRELNEVRRYMEAKLEAEKLLQCVQCVVLLLNLHF